VVGQSKTCLSGKTSSVTMADHALMFSTHTNNNSLDRIYLKTIQKHISLNLPITNKENQLQHLANIKYLYVLVI
jgi:hypothetical protein